MLAKYLKPDLLIIDDMGLGYPVETSVNAP
ncbi:MAG: hypothetical protein JWL59_3672 [Chthoniobacteraceae bacterium]|nr:hypothetical protein [Chthoniobacteraceae bacterium]